MNTFRFCDGKYEIIRDGDGRITAKRHGEPWPAGRDMFLGSKFLHSVLDMIEGVLAENERMKAELASTTRVIDKLGERIIQLEKELVALRSPVAIVPEPMESFVGQQAFDIAFASGWNECRSAMLAAAPEAPQPIQQAEPVGEIHKSHLGFKGQHWCKEVLLYSPNSPHDSPQNRVKLYTAPPSEDAMQKGGAK